MHRSVAFLGLCSSVWLFVACSGVEERSDSTPGEWINIRAGTFLMGSPEAERGHRPIETQHEVTLTHDFEILSTEVTRAEFEGQMGYDPSNSGAIDNRPIDFVEWHEAAAYCNALSEAEGLTSCYVCAGRRYSVQCEPSGAFASPYDCPGYRLPTEAEWEYAARAGTEAATYNGDLDVDLEGTVPPPHPCEESDVLDPIAWWRCTSEGSTREVGSLEPNDFGLYDMLGNVWEWCHDWYGEYPSGSVTDPWGPMDRTDAYGRNVRGGSANVGPDEIRAAYRGRDRPEAAGRILLFIGFRPVRTRVP